MAFRGCRALIVTAHPDDEVMFFAPTIARLRRTPGARLNLLCLSTGNLNGLGNLRTAELRKSCAILGFHPESVNVVDSGRLQDGMDQYWSPDLIADLVADFATRHDINLIISFDANGVSYHPNHCAIFAGLQCLAARPNDNMPRAGKITLLALESTHVLRKYLSIPEFLVLSSWNIVRLLVRWIGANNDWGGSWVLVTTVSPLDLGRAFRAMAAHWSQLVWYRMLFILFARYTILNTLTPILPASIHEKDQ